jgi:cell division septal protein FtsQ
MKEQVIASRGPRRSAGSTERHCATPGAPEWCGARSPQLLAARAVWLSPGGVESRLAVLVLITLIVGYRVAASAALFQVRTIDVTGTTRTSAEEIEG